MPGKLGPKTSIALSASSGLLLEPSMRLATSLREAGCIWTRVHDCSCWPAATRTDLRFRLKIAAASSKYVLGSEGDFAADSCDAGLGGC